ncbi:hypothetical protein PENSPDRAFT_660469 [Peniophora sp. CONT]|nr:hypothetical protein PENSPDRAFT_660469 [Peniophora sp. CONT]
MSCPTRVAFSYKGTTVIVDTPHTHAVRAERAMQKALEEARRDFIELRNVEDERIHFSVYVKLHTAGFPQNARISPATWESYIKTVRHNGNNGFWVMYINVDWPKLSWSEWLGLKAVKKGGKTEVQKRSGNEEVEAELPAYSKTTA